MNNYDLELQKGYLKNIKTENFIKFINIKDITSIKLNENSFE